MDWQLTCRICLETGDVVSLFDWDENNEQLSDKYTFCCGVELRKGDSLPTLICLNCVDKLTFAYKFKQQCLSSNDTLRECLEEFRKSSAVASASTSKVTETETITIKQENGVLLQYELPVEHDPHGQWSRSTLKAPMNTVITKSPRLKKKGRPRKYPNEQGHILLSPYQRKKLKEKKEQESLTSLLANGSLEDTLKEEPLDEEEPFGGGDYPDDDPDFMPQPESEAEAEAEEEKQSPSPRKVGRPRKRKGREPKRKPKDDGEDVLLKETILAFSEPIPEHILNPKPKKKYRSSYKKRYNLEKTHTCETCGSSFTSNATLQAHIRRHLGIKPFVCSVCGFACVMKEALKRHMLVHTGERPYKCRICERRFGDYGTRQKHERLHMGIRPYQCSLCGKAFTYSYVLSNHMLTHTGEKKYSCTPCGKKFTKAHHLKYHNKVHHKEVYIQQQIELEAKKARQQIKLTNLSEGVTGQIVDGTLQFVQATSEDGEQDGQMQVVEEHDYDNDEKETDRAVANMQGVVLDEDFCIIQK